MSEDFRMIVVYDEVREALYAAVDKAIAEQPGAAPDRENLYKWALGYFDEHGVVPDFRLEPKAQQQAESDVLLVEWPRMGDDSRRG